MTVTTDAADRVAAAVEARDEPAVLAVLAEHPEAAGARDTQGRSLLLLAIFHRLPEAVAALREARGDDLDALEAAATGRADLLAAQLEADRAGVLAARTPEGFDALGLAAFLGGADAVGVLLRHGARADGDPGNQLGVRPVHAAASAGD